MSAHNLVSTILVTILEPLHTERAEAIYGEITACYSQRDPKGMDVLLNVIEEILERREH